MINFDLWELCSLSELLHCTCWWTSEMPVALLSLLTLKDHSSSAFVELHFLCLPICFYLLQVIDMKRGKLEPKEKVMSWILCEYCLRLLSRCNYVWYLNSHILCWQVCEEPEKGIYFTKLEETNSTTQKVRDYAFNPFSNFLVFHRPLWHRVHTVSS